MTTAIEDPIAGFWFSTAHSTTVGKSSSSLRPIDMLSGLMRYLASALAVAGLQQQVAIVVKIAHAYHAPGADARG
jgi:hypothetical protein